MLIPASSTEYLHIPVTAPAGVDLTGRPVDIAVVAHSDSPESGEWQAAEWADGDARLLIGPGATLTLARGQYQVWVRVDPDGPEHITRPSGLLLVT
ncbi:hypothetical protein [Streptomyces venezuelae]